MLTADADGNTIAINTYDEYGNPETDSGGFDITTRGRFRYTGQVWLPELGMYYYKARIYSPALGRFMQTDPIGYEDQFNLYAYVGNDPINGVDPTGMMKRKPAEPPEPTIISQGSVGENIDRTSVEAAKIVVSLEDTLDKTITSLVEASGNEKEFGYQISFDEESGSINFRIYEGGDGQVVMAESLAGESILVSTHAHNGIGTNSEMYPILRTFGQVPDMTPQQQRPSGADEGMRDRTRGRHNYWRRDHRGGQNIGPWRKFQY